MPTYNQFFRFKPASYNGGFYPAMNEQSYILNQLLSEFDEQDYLGLNFKTAIQDIADLVNLYNSEDTGGQFLFTLLVSAIDQSGNGNVVYEIYNKQSRAVDSNQVVFCQLTISSFLVTNADFNWNGSVVTAIPNTMIPLIPAEYTNVNSLWTQKINGSAAFPIVWDYNLSTEILSTQLARGGEWRFNSILGMPTRNEFPLLPYRASRMKVMPPLTTSANYVITLLEGIINKAKGGTSLADLLLYADTFISNSNSVPQGWDFNYFSLPTDKVEFAFVSDNYTINMAGCIYSGRWKFQRFIAYTSYYGWFIDQFAFTEMPITPSGGSDVDSPPFGILYLGEFYDYDLLRFEPECTEPSEIYYMPAKTGDIFQINIPRYDLGITEYDTALVGLFDLEDTFIQLIGTAIIPEGGTQFQATFTIPDQPLNCYRIGLYQSFEDEVLQLFGLSNPIRIDNSDCFSTMIEFWADSGTIAQNNEYLNGWKQRVRIGLNGGGAKPQITESIYRQSNGVFKRPSNKLDLMLDLHTDFFDESTQFAMVDSTRHPYFVWNDKNVFVTGEIEVSTIQDFVTQSSFEPLSQMKMQVLIQGYQPFSSSCL
jgi:hypothetical protein